MRNPLYNGPPTPEEFQRQLQEFMRQHFPGSSATVMSRSETASAPESRETAGTTDGFKDIPIRANELDELLSSLKVPHSFELYEGGHGDHIRARIETKMLPFFSRELRASK